MFATLKSLISVHQKTDATSTEIEAALAGARDEMATAMRDRDTAKAAYDDGLLKLDVPALHQLTNDQSAAVIRRDRAAALVEALTKQLAGAKTAEDQVQRRERYDAAVKARTLAAKVLATEYPKHARALAGVLRTIAEADVLVQAANEALPTGTESLSRTEDEVRRFPGTPGRVLEEKTISLWCYPDGSTLHDANQVDVVLNADGVSGTYQPKHPAHSPPVTLHLRHFRKVKRIPGGYSETVTPLAEKLNLPELHALHVPFWKYGAETRPAGIIKWLDERAPLWGKRVRPTEDSRDVVIEILPLDEPANRAA